MPSRPSARELASLLEMRGLNLTSEERIALYADGVRLAGKLDDELGVPWSSVTRALLDAHDFSRMYAFSPIRARPELPLGERLSGLLAAADDIPNAAHRVALHKRWV